MGQLSRSSTAAPLTHSSTSIPPKTSLPREACLLAKTPLASQTGAKATKVSADAVPLFFHWRRAVGMEAFNRLQAPGLALLALIFGPGDRGPVGAQDQARTGIGNLDAISGRLVD